MAWLQSFEGYFSCFRGVQCTACCWWWHWSKPESRRARERGASHPDSPPCAALHAWRAGLLPPGTALVAAHAAHSRACPLSVSAAPQALNALLDRLSVGLIGRLGLRTLPLEAQLKSRRPHSAELPEEDWVTAIKVHGTDRLPGHAARLAPPQLPHVPAWRCFVRGAWPPTARTRPRGGRRTACLAPHPRAPH